MPKYKYKAKQGPSKILEGIVEADSIDAAIGKVMQSGAIPIDVVEATSSSKEKKTKKSILSFFNSRKIKPMDVVSFTRQMSDLVDASVPMLRALQIVHGQTSNQALEVIVKEMYKFVQDGGSFSEALSHHPKVFSQLYRNMIRTGEVGGNLEKVLMRLADYLEKEQETRSKIKSSLAYPILILLVGILTIFVLLTFVIPRLTVMFEDLGQALPLPTVILVNTSSFFASYWWLMVLAVFLIVVYYKKWTSTENGRSYVDTIKLKTPLLGEFIKVAEIGRFSRTLATLVESGVAITTALRSVWATVENKIIREEIKQVADEVTNGASLKVALNKCDFFPDVAVNMISVGEETGRLDRGLYKIADTFERQSDQAVKTMISLLGPLVLVGIVSIVGMVVIAMLLPIFQMNLLIQ